MAAFGEELLLGLRIEAVIDHAGEIAEAGEKLGIRADGFARFLMVSESVG